MNPHRAAIAWIAGLGVGVLFALAAGAARAGSDSGTGTDESLEARVSRLLEQNERMQEEIERLASEVRALRGEAAAAGAETAEPAEPVAMPVATTAATAAPPVAAEPPATPEPSGGRESLWSARIGTSSVNLVDLSLDVLSAVGTSTATDPEIELLQGGGHDPRQRGFTLQQAELSLVGAVDPYMNAEAHLIYFLDPEGESNFEIEEAFLQSIALPFGLDRQGFQVEAGHFFTEFGRINPKHPHAWDWQDQPFVLTRLLGEDGMRAPGMRIGWLLPLPWFSELHAGVQNAKGETMASFLANDEVFEERAIGGRPFSDRGVHSLADLVYLLRTTHGIDVSDEISAQLGGSLLLGPNATGNDGDTQIYGADLVVKWRPLDAERGWPFVKLEGEWLFRRYDADSFTGCFVPADGCTEVFVPGDTLADQGGYAQALWGFRRGWAAGLRYEYGSGSGSDVGFDDDTQSVVRVSRNADPFRGTRHRVSPLLAFHPSEYARLRLQYNYDHQRFLEDDDQHSVWAGVEFMLGAHPAHSY
jgi:hypothetical protein